MKDYRDVLIIYPLGLAGRHISNLISTDARFKQKATVNQYLNHKEDNVHLFDITGDKLFEVDNNLVLPMHLGMLIWNNHNLSKLNNPLTFIVEYPMNDNEVIVNRMKKYNSYLDGYMNYEFRSFYTIDIINKISGLDDFVTLNPEMIFQEDISSFLTYVGKETSLTLNTHECVNLHGVWFNKLNH